MVKYKTNLQIKPGTKMQQEKLIQVSRMTALISFIIGTLLFLIQLLFLNSVELWIVGFVYVGIATLINIIFVVALFMEMFLRPYIAEELMISLAIMLLNIPVVVLYILILINN